MHTYYPSYSQEKNYIGLILCQKSKRNQQVFLCEEKLERVDMFGVYWIVEL